MLSSANFGRLTDRPGDVAVGKHGEEQGRKYNCLPSVMENVQFILIFRFTVGA